jgi:16S rRNA processing protein RimM
MGRVLGPWGVKGALKIEPFGAESGNLCKYSAWWVGKPEKLDEVAVTECRAHGAHLVARFEGCDDPEKAGVYRGAEVALRREDLPEPAEHEFYQADLIGFEVVNAKGERLGRVAGFFSTGANDVMRVAHEAGERLVPATAQVIRRIDLEAGTVEVEWGADW